MQNSADGTVMTPSIIPVYLDTYELADLLGRTFRTVRSWRLTGASSRGDKGPPFKQFGSSKSPAMYLADDVQSWLIATGQGHLVPKLHAFVAQKAGV